MDKKNKIKSSWIENISLPENYVLSSKDEYMNDMQLKYFHNKLLEWRTQLIMELDHTLQSLKNKNMQNPDDTDRAFSESDTSLELRTRERYLKLTAKIDIALEKISSRTYGYCEESGEEIGLKRLDARPIASLTVEIQEQREKKEKLMIDPEEI